MAQKFPPQDPIDARGNTASFAKILAAGETILTAAIATDPATDGSTLTVGTPLISADGKMLTVRAAGGVAGMSYPIHFIVTTSAGDTLRRSVTLPIKNL